MLSALVSTFIDGLIGFHLAKENRAEQEAKWRNLGLDSIILYRKWTKHSEWNFSNKLYLLEAEYYFLVEDNAR